MKTLLVISALLVAHFAQPSLQIDYGNPIRSAADDEVKSLPGLSDQINFKHYSGYLNGDADNERFLHYWFVESQSDPANDPLILWLNGGPGCSSLGGMFTELGPFAVNNDSRTLRMNEYTWNKVANVIFLESPTDVGFSYSRTPVSNDDDTTSYENHLALKSFFKKFPQFKKNPLYLTGESYAGVYLPTLGVRVDEDPEMNLKGIAIGNGYLDAYKLSDSLVFFSYYHGLIGESTWAKISKYCCNNTAPSRETCQFSDTQSDDCKVAFGDALEPFEGGLNPYNIYADCAGPHEKNERLTRDIVGRRLMKTAFNLAKPNTTLDLSVGDEPPCTDDFVVINYLNQDSVRAAIHIPDDVQEWDLCSAIDYQMIYPLRKGGLTPQIMKLINSKRNLALMVYNGDVDSVCNFLGDEWFVDDLQRNLQKDYTMWHADGQVAGFTKKYKGITFTTIRGSGHMVPGDRPVEALEMLKLFLKSEM